MKLKVFFLRVQDANRKALAQRAEDSDNAMGCYIEDCSERGRVRWSYDTESERGGCCYGSTEVQGGCAVW